MLCSPPQRTADAALHTTKPSAPQVRFASPARSVAASQHASSPLTPHRSAFAASAIAPASSSPSHTPPSTLARTARLAPSAKPIPQACTRCVARHSSRCRCSRPAQDRQQKLQHALRADVADRSRCSSRRRRRHSLALRISPPAPRPVPRARARCVTLALTPRQQQLPHHSIAALLQR